MEKRAQGMSLQQRKDDLPEILRRFEQENMQKVAAEKNRCHFHLMAPVGWLNDPNGLSYFGDRYHVFFQYSPFAVNGGMKLWGHYTSKDLVQYKYEGAPFLPDETYDKDGVFSGSAIVWKDKMYLFYTGNVEEEGDHDYIHSGRGANVIRVISEDGEHFSAKQCILTNADYPAECTNQVRDPKLFQMADGTFRMVLGAWLQDDKGACCFIRQQIWSILPLSSSTQQKKLSDICGSARISLCWMGIAFLQCAHRGFLPRRSNIRIFISPGILSKQKRPGL